MRFNSDEQTRRSKRTNQRRADLFVVTLYSDRDAETVDEVLYWSDAFRRYDYNGTGNIREFYPTVRSRTGPNAETMTHIQDFGGTHAKNFELVLSNRPTVPGGPYLIEQLRDRLFRATIEVAEVLLRDDQDESDMSALPGDRHTVTFRGELSGIVKGDQDTVTIQFTTIEPTVPWLIVTGDHVDPDDLGKRFPIIYGQMKMVECVGVDVGASATLSAAITVSSTTIPVSNTDRFRGSGVIWIGSERITFAGKNSTSLTGCVRGTSSTTAQPHGHGDLVLEVRDSVFACAGHPVKAIGDVFTRRPGDREIVKITDGVTVDPIVEGAGPNGETVALIYVSAAQFETLIQSQETRQGRVTQQPSVNQQTEITTIAFRSVGNPDGDVPISNWGPKPVSGAGLNPEIASTLFSPSLSSQIPSEPQTYTMRVSGPGGVDPDEPIPNHDTNDAAVFVVTIGFNPADGNALTGADIDGLEGTQAGGAFWVSEPFTIPENSSIPAFDVDIPIEDVRRLKVFNDTDGNRDIGELILVPSLSDIHDWDDLTLGGAGGVVANLYRKADGLFQSTITTDIEIAGDDASTVKTEVGARGGACRLKIFANVDGWTDDGLTTGALLEDFPEIADHFIEVVCGVTNGGDHSDTRPFADDSLAGLPHAMDMRTLGERFAPIMTRFAWESRCNIQRTEGQVTPSASSGTVDALSFNGVDESMASSPGEVLGDRLGIANTWTYALALRMDHFDNGGNVMFQADDQNTFINAIYFGEATAGNLARVHVYGDDGVSAKIRTYDLTDFTIDGGYTEIAVLFFTWDGTTLTLRVNDGTEITPVASPSDDALTQTDTHRFYRVNDPFEGDFVGMALWTSVLGTAEQTAVTTLMRGGSALTVDSGAYTSSADLVQHFRPGIAGVTDTHLTILDDTAEGIMTSGDTTAVSDIFDTDGYDAVRIVQLVAGFSVPTGPANVTALFEHGNDPGLSDATTIPDALLLDADAADFDFEVTADTLTAGTPVTGTYYDVTNGSAKRYIRVTLTATGLAGGEEIDVFITTRGTPTGFPGDTWISNAIARPGGISPAADAGAGGINASDLVELAAAAPAVPGNTFYRYLPAGPADVFFQYGFPYTNDTSEDSLGAILDQYKTVSERPRDPETIKNRFRVLFEWDASRGAPRDGDAYRSTIGATRDGSEIPYPGPGALAASEERWGRREETPFLFLTIRQNVTAIDTLSYLVHTALLDTRSWEFVNVPWEIAYERDVGDTIAVPEVPWAPDEPWIARILGIAREPDTGMANITLFAVQRRGVFIGAATYLNMFTGAGTSKHGVAAAGAGSYLTMFTGAGTAIFLVTGAGFGSILSDFTGAGSATHS